MSSPSRLSSTCPPSILPFFRGNRFSSRFSYRTKSSCTPLTPFVLRTSYPSILAACFHLLTVLRDITSWDLSKKVSLRWWIYFFLFIFISSSIIIFFLLCPRNFNLMKMSLHTEFLSQTHLCLSVNRMLYDIIWCDII